MVTCGFKNGHQKHMCLMEFEHMHFTCAHFVFVLGLMINIIGGTNMVS